MLLVHPSRGLTFPGFVHVWQGARAEGWRLLAANRKDKSDQPRLQNQRAPLINPQHAIRLALHFVTWRKGSHLAVSVLCPPREVKDRCPCSSWRSAQTGGEQGSPASYAPPRVDTLLALYSAFPGRYFPNRVPPHAIAHCMLHSSRADPGRCSVDPGPCARPSRLARWHGSRL